MSRPTGFPGVHGVLVTLVLLGLVGSSSQGQPLSYRSSASSDSTRTAGGDSRSDSLLFSDLVLLGARDLGEAVRWLPGCMLLRYGGFGQPGFVVHNGLVASSLVSLPFVDPCVWGVGPDWSAWPVGFQDSVTPVPASATVFGTPVQVNADLPWRSPDKPYSRVGYTTGAYGLSQVAIRFTERVPPGVQLWLEGSHDLYEGYELFSGFRNQLYIWRTAWNPQPHWKLRYRGRRFARDVDLPGPQPSWSGSEAGAGFQLTRGHRKTAWTGHELQLGWKPDSLRAEVLTLALGYGSGRMEWRGRDPACPTTVNQLRQGQMHVVYRDGRWIATASLGYLHIDGLPSNGAHSDWRVQATRRLFAGARDVFSLAAGFAGGTSAGVSRAAPEALLRFSSEIQDVKASFELFHNTWLPRPRIWPCPSTVLLQKQLAQRTGVQLRLEGSWRHWHWLSELAAVQAVQLPKIDAGPDGRAILVVSDRRTSRFSMALAGPRTSAVFGRAKLDFYTKPFPGLPRVYALLAFGVRRRLFQGDLDVRVLALGEFISRRQGVVSWDYVGFAGSSLGVTAPAGFSPSLRVVARFKDADLFFEVDHFLGDRLEYAPGFPDDPVAYRWGVWWEFWD